MAWFGSGGGNNTWGFGGSVQMGDDEMARLGVQGGIQRRLQQQKTGDALALQQPQLDLQKYLGDQSNDTQRFGIQQNNDTARYRTDRESATQQNIAGMNNATQRYQVDRTTDQRERESQLQAALTREGNTLQDTMNQRNVGAQRLPAELQQSRFNQVFPLLTSQLGQLGGDGNYSGGYRGNGQVGTQPTISDAPVYSEQQIQQNVNAQWATNDQTAAGQTARMRAQLAGRGYGANSPLASLLQQNYLSQALGANTANERETRLGAATANSAQVLKAQQAREQQFASRQGEDIERNKVYQGNRNAILSALVGLV